jgi:dTDP-4-dehydrorhamnose 3,5-epimerase
MARVDVLGNVTEVLHDSYNDHRGQLYTIWKSTEIKGLNFNHDKVATSHHNVLRGLHTDKSWKLITCLYGKIQLVVVNFNNKSSDYLNWTDYIIDSESSSKISVLVPPGYLNGHLVLSDEAVFHYKWSYEGEYPDVDSQVSVMWSDPKIGINWLSDNPILSDRDKNIPLL